MKSTGKNTMVESFAKVISSSAYQAMSPAEQYAARRQYYRDPVRTPDFRALPPGERGSLACRILHAETQPPEAETLAEKAPAAPETYQESMVAKNPQRDNRRQPEPLLPCQAWKRAVWDTIFNAGRNSWPRFLLKVAGAQGVHRLWERIERILGRLDDAEEIPWSEARAVIIEFLEVVHQAPIDTEFFETLSDLLERGGGLITSPDGDGAAWLSFKPGFQSPDRNPVYSTEEMRVVMAESKVQQRLIHQFKLTGQRLIQDPETGGGNG